VTIPHDEQRYSTVGDWQIGKVEEEEFTPHEDGRTVYVAVSDLKDWRFNMLVGVHELIEAILCKNAGISQQSVDDFDMTYEQARTSFADPDPNNPHRLRLFQVYDCNCEITDTSEPGDDVHAPYHEQHKIATAHETSLATSLDVDWDEYNGAIEALS
jgi:hypothetical protein